MLYLPYEVASLEGIMHGLYLFWWVQERHFSPALVATILAAGDFALLVLEVPTGWFADRFGHRRSLIAGSLAQVAGMLFCWFGRSLSDLIAASVLVAAGDAFRSGADHALLYRTCVALGREGDFQRFEARTRAAQLAAMVLLVLTGGAIVTRFGFAAGWAAETSLCSVGLAIALAMREPPAACGDEGSDSKVERPRHARANARALAAVIVPTALLGGLAGGTAFFAQTTGDAEPMAITVLVAVITLAEAAGAAWAMRLSIAGARTQRWLLLIGLLAMAMTAMLPSTFLVTVGALSFLVGVAHPLRSVAIQRTVDDDVRARAASLASAADMAVNLVALPIAGAYRARRSGRR
jgi:MFS family permease